MTKGIRTYDGGVKQLKWGHGDRVSHSIVPGKWIIYSPSPKRSHYYLEPDDDTARALAELLPYGMLETKVADITERTVNRQLTALEREEHAS